MAPTLGKIQRINGMAGQVGYVAEVTYPEEEPMKVTFLGSAYGGSVVMQTPSSPEGVFVTEPGRFGEFGPGWVRRFFGLEE